jgi:hypothetical protein
VEDLNNKKAAIIPTKTAIGDEMHKNHRTIPAPKKSKKKTKRIKAYGFPVFYEK